MIPKLLVTSATLTYGLVVPILEINATHVFNPDWPAHARLHEVWQLATNSAFAVLALWLVWARDRIGAAVAIGLSWSRAASSSPTRSRTSTADR